MKEGILLAHELESSTPAGGGHDTRQEAQGQAGKERVSVATFNISTLRKARRQRDAIDRHDRDHHHHRFEFYIGSRRSRVEGVRDWSLKEEPTGKTGE